MPIQAPVLPHDSGQAVLIGVHMGDEDGGDRVQRDPARRQPVGQRLQTRRVIPARVGQDDAGGVLDHVAPHLAQRVVRDRHGHGPHAAGDPARLGVALAAAMLPSAPCRSLACSAVLRRLTDA
jgi:hypothetical protein